MNQTSAPGGTPAKDIIFDLGGVILKIDFALTFAAFAELGVANFEAHFAQHHQSPLFDAFEVGQVTPADFRTRLCAELQIAPSEESFDAAWSAMLLHFKPGVFDLLERLRQRHRIFLLSNTNALHRARFDLLLKRDVGDRTLDSFFDRVYYSHLLGLRKPTRECFLAVLEREGLTAASTLFVDDTIENIVGAKSVGLQTLHLSPERSIHLVEQYATLS